MTCKQKLYPSLLFLIATALLHAQNSSEIDPMLGADKGGNVFIGPTLPFGMAKPGPDYGDNEGNAGWRMAP
jgi:putative alpha-1,2-mannosidase